MILFCHKWSHCYNFFSSHLCWLIHMQSPQHRNLFLLLLFPQLRSLFMKCQEMQRMIYLFHRKICWALTATRGIESRHMPSARYKEFQVSYRRFLNSRCSILSPSPGVCFLLPLSLSHSCLCSLLPTRGRIITNGLEFPTKSIFFSFHARNIAKD